MFWTRRAVTSLLLLPLSFAFVLQSIDRDRQAAVGSIESGPSRIARTSHHERDSGSSRRRGANVIIGGTELELVRGRKRSRSRVRKRRYGNGTIIDLGTTDDTYIIPVSIGTPPVTYPLQLDLGSSDLLLASTLCGANCPSSLGSNDNPYYDPSKSGSFGSVNGNSTDWQSRYADGRMASGFIATETVSLGGITLTGQAFGLINTTNLTLAQQDISGILGLGFPRLSTLSRALLGAPPPSSSAQGSPTSSTASSSVNASQTSTISTPSASSTYLPPVLEHLVSVPDIPYPVFALALSPPILNVSSTSAPSSLPSPTASGRFKPQFGSLTLGGVSSLYVSNDTSSGRTIDDIEWHEVIPFGLSVEPNATAHSPATAAPPNSSSVYSSTSSTSSSSNIGQRRRQIAISEQAATHGSTIPATPISIPQLDSEEYLYWTLELRNISVNGTNLNPNSTYSSQGVPTIAILDVGFNGLAGPQQDVERLFEMVQDARQTSEGQWAVPCDTDMTLGFSFGGRYVQLQPSDWIYAQITGTSFCLAWPIAVQSAGDGIDWQLGTPFLRNVYSVFSYGVDGVQAPLIGFLPLASNSSSGYGFSSTSTPTSSQTSPTSQLSTSSSTSSNITSTSPAPSPYGPTPTTVIPNTPTSTINALLPNVVLPDPTFQTPSYLFGSMPTAGAIQTEGLGNSSAYQVGDVPVISPSGSSVATVGPQTGSEENSNGGTKSGGASSSRIDIGTSLVHLVAPLFIAFLST